jgi:hypothetical protein
MYRMSTVLFLHLKSMMTIHIVYPVIVWFWVLIKGVKWTSVLLSHRHNKAFLVPDSCRETETNGNSISIDATDDAIESDSQNDTCCFRLFDIAGYTQYTHCR